MLGVLLVTFLLVVAGFVGQGQVNLVAGADYFTTALRGEGDQRHADYSLLTQWILSMGNLGGWLGNTYLAQHTCITLPDTVYR